jgi:hypothetical protein
MGFKEWLGIGVAATGAVGGMNAAEAGQGHREKIVDADQAAHVEVIKDPEKMLKIGGEWAAQEAAHQAEGGSIEKGPSSVFTGPHGEQVYFEDNTGSSSGVGELVAVVRFEGGLEKKFVLRKSGDVLPDSKGNIPPRYVTVGSLDDLEAQEQLRMASK